MALLTRLRTARAIRTLGRLAEHGPPGVRGGVPTSVAIIMDGNGRWAEQRRLPVSAGHRAGARALKQVVREAADIGIRDLTVFSFSTENWSRPRAEVDDLMGLFCELIDREIPALHEERVRVRFIGRCEHLPSDLRERIAAAEALTGDNDGLRLFIAMNYGGRAEIVDAARRFATEAGPEATENDFGRYLYGPDMGDPELVIRTSGEQRLSNFLLWQAAYAELHFSPKFWPDFTPDDLRAAIDDYAGRQRRFGSR